MVKEWCLVSECKDCRPRGAWAIDVAQCPGRSCDKSWWRKYGMALDAGEDGDVGDEDEE